MSTDTSIEKVVQPLPETFNDFGDIPDLPSDLPPQARTYAYWVNGKMALKRAGGIAYTGGWAIDSGKIDANAIDPALWDLTVLATKEGTEFQVYSAEVVQAAIIGYRTSWIDQAQPPRFAKEFEAGLRHYVEIACVLKGVRDAVVLSAKGYNAQNLLSAYTKGTNDIRMAIKASKPPFAFWLPLGGEIKPDGQPAFTMVGKNEQQSGIVRIVPRFAAKPDVAWAKANVVTPALFAECAAQLPLLPTWKNERFTAQAQRETSQNFGSAAMPEDPPEDIPFE